MNSIPLLKILHVLPSMDPQQGGVRQAVVNMISGLPSDRVLNEVLSLDNAESVYLTDAGFTVHALGKGKGPWNYNRRLIAWLMANLTYFDTVIVHGLWHYSGYAVKTAYRKLISSASETMLPKLLVMPHGMLDPYFQRASNRRLKALRNVVFWKLVESKLINDADALLFTCEEEETMASVPFNPYRPKRTIVVGLGLQTPLPFNEDMKNAFLEKCSALNGSSYFLFLGRIDEKKGVDIMIKGYAKIIRKLEENQKNLPVLGVLPKLVIAGPGLNSAYGRKMEQLVLSHRELRGMVLFPGMLSGDAKWGAFYGSEAFVLPSHQENFGIAVVEALACGVPALISNQVNIWREINEMGGGYVSSDNAEGAYKMFEFWSNSSYKQQEAMRRNAFRCYTKYFSAEQATKRLMKAFQEVSRFEGI